MSVLPAIHTVLVPSFVRNLPRTYATQPYLLLLHWEVSRNQLHPCLSQLNRNIRMPMQIKCPRVCPTRIQ